MSRRFLNGIDAALQKIKNVASGSDPSDAVNVAQLQAALAGLSWHGALRAASTANVTVSSPGASLDGVNLAASNRLLLKNQTTASENGVYLWNGSSAALTRASDGTQGNLNAGAAFYVDEGTTNADTAWTLATDDPITVGTTSLTFNKFGASNAYTAATGGGLLLNGTAFSVDTSKIPYKLATNIGDGTSTTITVTHNLNTMDVIAQLYDTSSNATVEADVVRASVNTMSFTFAVAPGSSAYRAVMTG